MNQIIHNNKKPDFIIVGTQKGGTTSLYRCLSQHPSIVPLSEKKKELHFFSSFYNKGNDWYLEQFPEKTPEQISGEGSPFYLFHPHAAERIADTLPDVKIIIMLRNPIHRAISHYHQQYRRNHEDLPMMEAFKKEEERISGDWQKLINKKQVSSETVQKCSYLKRGEYLEQIKRYKKYFSDQQILIIESESFFQDPRQELEFVFKFLAVDKTFQPTDIFPRKPGSYQDTPTDILNFLENYFKPHNEALFSYLDQHFSW